MGQGLPICFPRNSTNAGCVSVYPQTWKKTVVQSMMKGIPIYQTGQAALSQAFRPCRTETMETEESAFKKIIQMAICYNPSSLL